MEALVELRLAVLLASTAVLGGLVAGQTLHVFLVVARTEIRQRVAVVVYECLVLAHLLLGMAVAYAAASHWGAFVLRLFHLRLPLEPLLWCNAAAAALAAGLGVALRRPRLLFEAVLLSVWTPVGLWWASDAVPVLGLVTLTYFAFRVVSDLSLDARRLRREVSRFSVTEAIMKLPEGFLLADPSGRIWLMNDTMRSCLVALGFPTDLADTRGLWAALQRKATEEPGGMLPEGIVLTLSDDEARFFTVDAVTLRGRDCQRILAFDITDEHRLNHHLARTNELLERAAQELRAALDRVGEAARAAALLSARSRVHDVIGQRLSMLHRYLEDDEIEEEPLARMEPILREILADLSDVGQTDAAAELEAIVAAFALINVAVEVTGELPEDPEVADGFVQIVREATTNAVKHGQATTVAVAISQVAGQARLQVSNDGPPVTPGALREGLGLPGMRQAAAALGGTLTVCGTTPFTVTVVIPGSSLEPSEPVVEGALA